MMIKTKNEVDTGKVLELLNNLEEVVTSIRGELTEEVADSDVAEVTEEKKENPTSMADIIRNMDYRELEEKEVYMAPNIPRKSLIKVVNILNGAEWIVLEKIKPSDIIFMYLSREDGEDSDIQYAGVLTETTIYSITNPVALSKLRAELGMPLSVFSSNTKVRFGGKSVDMDIHEMQYKEIVSVKIDKSSFSLPGVMLEGKESYDKMSLMGKNVDELCMFLSEILDEYAKLRKPGRKVAVKENEDLLFSISCLDGGSKYETEDKIYYLPDFIEDDESDGDYIWVINHDGTGNRQLSKKQYWKAQEIDSVDDKWVYYIAEDDSERKMTIKGTMDREEW